jgi:hypothetical protein
MKATLTGAVYSVCFELVKQRLAAAEQDYRERQK